ncbi:MAG TPA: hypothetical protein VN903_03000 [Polyangia bacterium]|nr:hypothetical protein [Polyangia bacterium]
MPRFSSAAASYREATEDRALTLTAGAHSVVCVADGTSGLPGAAAAAETFIAGVQRAVELRTIDLTDGAAWTALFCDLDREIEQQSLAGETTGIALAITPTSVVGASAGDSRAWLFGETSVELTADQIRKPRLGTGWASPRPFAAPARGTLVVGSDGLFDYVPIDEIRAVARGAADDVASALVDLVHARSGTLVDDVVIVVAVLDEASDPSP